MSTSVNPEPIQALGRCWWTKNKEKRKRAPRSGPFPAKNLRREKEGERAHRIAIVHSLIDDDDDDDEASMQHHTMVCLPNNEAAAMRGHHPIHRWSHTRCLLSPNVFCGVSPDGGCEQRREEWSSPS